MNLNNYSFSMKDRIHSCLLLEGMIQSINFKLKKLKKNCFYSTMKKIVPIFLICVKFCWYGAKFCWYGAKFCWYGAKFCW